MFYHAATFPGRHAHVLGPMHPTLSDLYAAQYAAAMAGNWALYDVLSIKIGAVVDPIE